MTIIHSASTSIARLPTSPRVSPTYEAINSTFNPVFGGVTFNLDGVQYRTPANQAVSSTTQSQGVWLDDGLNSEVWLDVILISGDFNHTDDGAGAGRQVLSTSRTFISSKATPGSKITVATFGFYDAASGGNLLRFGTITISLFNNG